MRKVFLSTPLKQQAIDLMSAAGLKVDVNTGDRPQGEELLEIIKNYDVIQIGVRQKLTPDIVTQIETPKVIATMSTGLDHIDKAFLRSPMFKIVNIKKANAISVAEHIFALILALSKRVMESQALTLNNGNRNDLFERPVDISNKIIGFVGAGNITQEAMRFATAFRMKILCNTANPEKHADIERQGIEFVPLDDLLQRSDIINVSIPLTKDTYWFISRDKIALIKPTATFINTSRAEVVDTKALIEYADTHSTFYAGLDIDADTEELAELFKTPRRNVIVTPHTAGVSKEAIDRMDLEIAESILLATKD
ncbi:MAG: hypothetical protein LBG88_01085 [Christensenellaceae bacterium]|jgi:phosphoglycerate dehydrogenase-like enzyme|nr:hypothetical protein [Christensenellaceae bacterium]